MGRRFKDFVLEEGDLLDAVTHGFKTGVRAFVRKRAQQARKQESRTLADRLLDADGKELEGLIKQIVDNGYALQPPARPRHSTDWLKECTTTRKTSSSARSPSTTSPPCWS